MTIQEELKWVNEMFDGMEVEVRKRRVLAVGPAAIESLDRMTDILKKKREQRLAEIDKQVLNSQ